MGGTKELGLVDASVGKGRQLPVLPTLETGPEIIGNGRVIGNSVAGGGPVSAASSNYSSLSLGDGGHPIPGDQEDDGVNAALLPDLNKLSLEKGRPLDVEDLDDEGWLAASEQKKIVELDSLGEGAGGAVTRCMLKDGKTIFALKVCECGMWNVECGISD